MKTLMLFIALTAAALARAAEPEPKTDEQINREAVIAVAKAVALRKMQAEQSASAKIESKRVFDAAIDAMVTIFQVVPSQGILAKPILAQRGPPHLVRISHHEMVQGTGLDSHKQVAHDWVEVREERAPSLPSRLWVRARRHWGCSLNRQNHIMHKVSNIHTPVCALPGRPPIPLCSGHRRTHSGALLRFVAAACACCGRGDALPANRRGRWRGMYPPPPVAPAPPRACLSRLGSLDTPGAYLAGWFCPQP